MTPQRHAVPLPKTPTERRLNGRFLLDQEVRYRVVDGQESGQGRTLNVSSRGVLFTTERPLARGARVQVSMNWPVDLEDGCGLKLVAMGRVLRSGERETAMVIEKYEFRTRSASRTE